MSSHREYSSLLNTTNWTIQSSDISNMQSTFITRSLPVLYPCIIFTSIIFNTLIFIVMRRPRMAHLSTCYYMGILAIVDSILLFGLLDLWLYLLNPKWPPLSQSTFSCRVLTFLLYSISHISEWIVCLMSIDRCIAVTRPLHASSICTVRRAKISLCILILCIFLINGHYLFTFELTTKDECKLHERYGDVFRRVWVWIDAAVYSILPFILLLIVNLIIIYSLFRARHSSSSLRVYNSRSRQKKNISSTSTKLTTMLLAVTVSSLFTSFPIAYLEIYTEIRQETKDSPFIRGYVRPLSITLPFAKHYINFFLYAMAGEAFRSELKQVFHNIAVKMHLIKNIRRTSINRRSTQITYKYSTNNSITDERPISPTINSTFENAIHG